MTPNLRGGLFMIASMAGFAVEDMLLKAATRHGPGGGGLPLGQALALFGFLGLMVFIALARRGGHPARHRSR